MDTSVTPMSVGGRLIRGALRHANAVRGLLSSGNMDAEVRWHRRAHRARMYASTRAMHQNPQSRRAFLRRQMLNRDDAPGVGSCMPRWQKRCLRCAICKFCAKRCLKF